MSTDILLYMSEFLWSTLGIIAKLSVNKGGASMHAAQELGN